MQLLITASGAVHCVYAETIDLAEIGRVTISRGSHVEPDDDGRWYVDLAPVDGPRIGPFPRRSDALHAEGEWLRINWLSQPLD